MSIGAVGPAGFGVAGALATGSPAGGAGAAGGTGAKSFASMVQDGLRSVSQQEFNADGMVEALASGQDVAIADVMAATSKAGLSIDLLVQVRNKALEAYREVMNMQV